MIEGRLGVYQDEQFQRIGAQIAERGIFIGCAADKFAATSKDMLIVASDTGLQRNQTVLEVGAGCLRTGVWFIEYLDPGRYCGLEPNVAMLDTGREFMLGRLQNRNPEFDHNAEFDFDVFGRSFDWIVGFSIWSHCSKDHIRTIIENAGRMKSRLLFSFAPTHPRRPEYQGDKWIGKSHESDEKGIAYHDPAFLMACSKENGLSPYIIAGVSAAQIWFYAEPAS